MQQQFRRRAHIRRAKSKTQVQPTTVERPSRTREHYIADVSRVYIEGLIVRQGYTVETPRSDYGYDMVMTTYDYKGDPSYSEGQVENGGVYIQLKATDTLKLIDNQRIVSYEIKRKHAAHWIEEPDPVYLIVYSVKDETAYWLHMQVYLKTTHFAMLSESQQTISVRIPRTQVVNAAAIEEFRTTKQNVLQRIRGLDLYA